MFGEGPVCGLLRDRQFLCIESFAILHEAVHQPIQHAARQQSAFQRIHRAAGVNGARASQLQVKRHEDSRKTSAGVL